MTPGRPTIGSQITFLYYADIEPAAAFYGGTLGLELVVDEGWARIFRVGERAFVGVVDGTRGVHRPQERSAVLVTFVVDDVDAWHRYLAGEGVALATDVQDRPDIALRHFFLKDPGGYSVEIQQFLRPEVARAFGQTV